MVLNMYMPSLAAIKQSNRFACGFPIKEPLADEFIGLDFGSYLGSSGFPIQKSSSTGLFHDDLDLQNFFQIVESNLGSNTTICGVTGIVRKSLYPRDRFLPVIEAWYDNLVAKEPFQIFKLGYFIKSGMGMCTQVSMLTKATCDHFGLPCTLVTGFQGGHHFWCKDTRMIYDGDLAHDMLPIATLNFSDYVAHSDVYGDRHNELAMLTEKIYSSTDQESLLEARLQILAFEESAGALSLLLKSTACGKLGIYMRCAHNMTKR